MFGPLRHLWMLRFEGKHKYFKNVIRHLPSFKNVGATLSMKHQYLQAINDSLNADLYSNKILSDSIKPFELFNYSEILLTVLNKKHELSNYKFIADDVIVQSIIYKKIC